MCGDNTRKELMKYYKHRCAYCGSPIKPHETTIDHVFPKSKGGRGGFSNLKPSCSFCNFSKGSLSIEGFRNKLKNDFIQNTKSSKKTRNKFKLRDGEIVFHYEDIEKEVEQLESLLNYKKVKGEQNERKF